MGALNYRAIFFDLDGTLRYAKPSVADAYREQAGSLGLVVDEKKQREVGRWEHYYWAHSPELQRDSEKFAGDQAAFWDHYMALRLRKMGASSAQVTAFLPILRKYFNEEYAPKNRVPSDAYRLLPELRSDGYLLAVLSNRRSSLEEALRELALQDYFDAAMSAGEIGAWKPDPAIFSPLLKRFSLLPHEVLYVGDNYYADVVGARNAGLTPVLYDPRGVFPDADCFRITSFSELRDVASGER
jgi:FMN phosphatase YigB (HAD superfamily)